MRARSFAVLLGLLLILVMVPVGAEAATPGAEGEIAFIEPTRYEGSISVNAGDIRVVNPDGTGVRTVVESDFAGNPRWSPGGDLLSYGDPDGVFVVESDGSNSRRIGSFGAFDWAPDGSGFVTVEFVQSPDMFSFWYELVFVSLDGQTQRVIADCTADRGCSIPTWSPDGSMIAFVENDGELTVVNVDGSGRRVLDDTGDFIDGLDFSPDGTQIVYDGDEGIAVIDVASGAKTMLTDTDESGLDETPSFSPDGSEIVFSRFDYWSEPLGIDLWIMNADGSNQRLLVKDGYEPDWRGIVSFIDAPLTSTFFADIEWLAAEGITKGCNPPANNLFCPSEAVTRGQMAAFLHRALPNLPLGAFTDFIDDDGSVFEADIEWLSAAGVTRGCNPPANTFYCPGDPVTRGQMAAFLVRALGLTDDGGGNTFVDDNGSVFEDDIARLAAGGITRGCNPPVNDRFCPQDPITRGQMAAFLHRALGG